MKHLEISNRYNASPFLSRLSRGFLSIALVSALATPTVVAEEPQQRPDAEEEALIAAFLGQKFVDPAQSSAVADAIDELNSQSAPKEEVFALITVTDRNTGERRILTRGTPDPLIAQYLRDPASAPAGLSYSESDEITATEEIEISIRAVSVHSETAGAELSPEEEEEFKLEARNSGTGFSHRLESGLTERIASGEIDLEGEELVPVYIDLKNVPRLDLPKMHDVNVAGLLWAGLDIQAAREEAIIERKQVVQELQNPLIGDIQNVGGEIHYASWTSGAVEARVPAFELLALTEREDVFSIEYVEDLAPACATTNNCYQGDDYHKATNYEDFDPFHVGRNGLSSKHAHSSRIVLAMAEECIDQNNPAWLDHSGNASRGRFFDCDPSGACTEGGVEACSVNNPHGTHVAQMMTGDFMDSQDSAVTTTNRRVMTGTCPECDFFFFQDEDLNDRTKAMDEACDLGVDIFESSIGSAKKISCDGNGYYDSALQALVNCDAVYVQAAANDGSTGGCSTHYPADHPWVFTVGGMDSETPCNTAADYFTGNCAYEAGASKGGGDYNSTSGAATIIDLAGPYDIANAINPGTSGPVTFGRNQGTSFSTPVVAGLMADMMDWFQVHVSNSIFFNNRMRNFMLLFGDRSRGSAGTTQGTSSLSDFWGAGRVILFPFDQASNFAMHRTSRSLKANNSSSFTVTVQPGETFFKAVAWHDGKDLSTEPRIGMTLNPIGCSAPTRSVNQLDSKAMMAYTGSTALNGCTGVRVTLTNVKQGLSGRRTFHFAALATDSTERNW